jgi:hypothetical protein
MKTFLLLLFVSLLCFSLASCQGAPEVAAAVGVAGATVMTLFDALAPLIPPEKLAALQATAGRIDGTVQATASALSTVADVITHLKTATASQVAAHSAAIAELPSRTEVYLSGTGIGTGTLAASRGLSILKHGLGKVPV